ncbi:bifunctional cytidylyltransferase/SDR family oxidoreductase [Komagataeibacter sp. FNDCR2]|uniref:bifunctional cytidylyltransferase/SDR family oxidoreductase n=1 Tax=Komagataeibacter sp. FNDCR2 TaxID=2878682 RepID=UPI001E31593C|nr:bifunctional cytidylyltransferase/SDR family oxidoreductase [Komagataeibacter sp. FNDCR2]MCE2576781.1 bifunctional cytidylyltransferase/SDR family oxidoreductase [Komagataeibacter sp. FNDCR2]
MSERLTSAVGVILAAGDGTRFGATIPKQFTKLAGRTVLEYTVDVFEDFYDIDEIIIVTKSEYVNFIRNISESRGWKKLKQIVVGGKNRIESTQAALNAMSSYQPDTKLLIHDAVRPFVTQKILSECLLALDIFPAVDTVVPSADTIVKVSGDLVSDIPDRSMLRRGQTPQGFRLGILQTAYENIIIKQNNRKTFTCDCSVLLAGLPGISIGAVDGSDSNIKITTPIDLFLSEKLIQSGAMGVDEDVDLDLSLLRGKRVVVFGGRCGIGKSICDMAKDYGAEVFSASRSENSVNVSHINTISSFLEDITKYGTCIDIIINTSGVMFRQPFASTPLEQIEEMIATNYLGVINVATAARPYLLQSKGCLINFSSSSYTRGRAFYAVYSSTKAAIVNFSQALAEEWEVDGIKVQCICPERTQTPMRTKNFGDEEPSTLLDPKIVAQKTLQAALLYRSGLIVDVRSR